jgi:lysophospholipase L1-like esterase
LAQLTQRTKAKIYVINIPRLGATSAVLPPLDYYFDRETDSYNKIIAALAAQYQVSYIDLNTPVKAKFRFDGAHYAADSFHPSAVGYQLWADIIYDSFDK